MREKMGSTAQSSPDMPCILNISPLEDEKQSKQAGCFFLLDFCDFFNSGFFGFSGSALPSPIWLGICVTRTLLLLCPVKDQTMMITQPCQRLYYDDDNDKTTTKNTKLWWFWNPNWFYIIYYYMLDQTGSLVEQREVDFRAKERKVLEQRRGRF